MLLSWIGHVNTTESSLYMSLFPHHSHICHYSWIYPFVIVILSDHRFNGQSSLGLTINFKIMTQYLFVTTIFEIDIKFGMIQ